MKKVYMIEYVECDIERNTHIEKSAFNSYRAASYFLLNLGYNFEYSRSYDFEGGKTYDDLDWTVEDEDYGNMWRANIHELLLVE